MANLTFLQPSAVQCGEAALQWMGGKPNYSVSVVSAQSALDSKVLAQVGSSFSPFTQYTVAIPAGTLIKFRVIDNSSPPQVADTILLSVGPSNDDSCLPADQRTNTSKSEAATKSTTSTRSSDENESSTKDGDEGVSSDSPTGSASVSPSSSHRSLSSSTTRGISAGEASSTGTGLLPSATDSSTNAAASESSSEQTAPHITPAVVAGIAGGLIFLIILATGIFLWRKHRGRRSLEDDEDWFAAQPPMTSQHNHVVSGSQSGADDSMALNRASPMARSRSLRAFMEDRSPNEAASTRSRPTTANSHADSTNGVPPLTHAYNVPQVIITEDSYPEDVKRPLVVMSADNYDGQPIRSTSRTALPPRLQTSSASQPPSDHASEDAQVPPQLSPEEMARLADLVASRMRTAPDNESLPAYY